VRDIPSGGLRSTGAGWIRVEPGNFLKIVHVYEGRNRRDRVSKSCHVRELLRAFCAGGSYPPSIHPSLPPSIHPSIPLFHPPLPYLSTCVAPLFIYYLHTVSCGFADIVEQLWNSVNIFFFIEALQRKSKVLYAFNQTLVPDSSSR